MNEYGCPRCRMELVQRLRHARFSSPDFPRTPASARHISATAAAVIVAGAAVLSAAIGGYSAYASAQAQSGAMEYNAMLQRQQAAYQQQLAEMEASLMERQAAGMLSMAEMEQALAEQQAKAATTAGQIREAAIRRNYERTQSDVRAAIGKSGVDTTGSPLLVLMENADTVGEELAVNDYQTALDVAGAKAGGAFAMAEGRMRSESLRAELHMRRFGGAAAAAASLGAANLLGMQAGSVRSAGMFNIGTSLLGGASGAASPFLRYGKTIG